MAIETYERKAKFAELKPYCHFAKPNDFIEVTEWHNGEGFDAYISGNNEQRVSLSWGQWEALQSLVTYKE